MSQPDTHVSHVYVSSRRLYIDSHTDDVFGSFGHIGPSPARKCFSYRFYTCGLFRTIANTWVTPAPPAQTGLGTRESSGDVELRTRTACPFPSAGTCVYYRQPTAAAGFSRNSTESLHASRIAAARAATSRPPASAVPPPRPERKVGARDIHAGPITPTTNRARTAQPRRHRPPHMPMCYMHATMHHAEHHAHLIYMRCEREGPCSVWPTRHDCGDAYQSASPRLRVETPCSDSWMLPHRIFLLDFHHSLLLDLRDALRLDQRPQCSHSPRSFLC